MHSNTHHHQHLRKRIHVQHEQFPHPNKLKRFLDKIIYIIWAAGPIMMLPQHYNIFVKHEVWWLAMSTWWAFSFMSLIWLLYWVIHKDKAIIFANTLWAIANSLVFAWILIYR